MERLGLNIKLLHTLQIAGIQTLEELRSLSPRKLALLPGIGSASLAELLTALHPSEVEHRLEVGQHIASMERRIDDYRRAIQSLESEIRRAKRQRDGHVSCMPPHRSA